MKHLQALLDTPLEPPHASFAGDLHCDVTGLVLIREELITLASYWAARLLASQHHSFVTSHYSPSYARTETQAVSRINHIGELVGRATVRRVAEATWESYGKRSNEAAWMTLTDGDIRKWRLFQNDLNARHGGPVDTPGTSFGSDLGAEVPEFVPNREEVFELVAYWAVQRVCLQYSQFASSCYSTTDAGDEAYAVHRIDIFGEALGDSVYDVSKSARQDYGKRQDQRSWTYFVKGDEIQMIAYLEELYALHKEEARTAT